MNGGELFPSLLGAGLVDGVDVAVMPAPLGGGVPLLPPPAPRTTLALKNQRVYEKSRNRGKHLARRRMEPLRGAGPPSAANPLCFNLVEPRMMGRRKTADPCYELTLTSCRCSTSNRTLVGSSSGARRRPRRKVAIRDRSTLLASGLTVPLVVDMSSDLFLFVGIHFCRIWRAVD
jgi:hypothetical protein